MNQALESKPITRPVFERHWIEPVLGDQVRTLPWTSLELALQYLEYAGAFPYNAPIIGGRKAEPDHFNRGEVP